MKKQLFLGLLVVGIMTVMQTSFSGTRQCKRVQTGKFYDSYRAAVKECGLCKPAGHDSNGNVICTCCGDQRIYKYVLSKKPEKCRVVNIRRKYHDQKQAKILCGSCKYNGKDSKGLIMCSCCLNCTEQVVNR